jgi:hypothetical protein
MGTDFSTFKDLAPERRMRELQKLIDALKKEIGEREKDIRQAEHLLALADEEARVLEQVEVPEAKTAPKRKPAKTEVLEEKTEIKSEPKRLTREEQAELEKLLATAPPRSEDLFHKIAHRPINELYSELRNIYDRERSTGVETSQDREMIYAIRRGLEEKKKDMAEGEYKADRQAKHLFTAAQQMAESMYQGGAGGYKRTPA